MILPKHSISFIRNKQFSCISHKNGLINILIKDINLSYHTLFFLDDIVTYRSIARQRLSIHAPANTQQLELCSLWTMLQLVARLQNNTRPEKTKFSMGSDPMLYNESLFVSRERHPCGGGVEYLHRDPASRRRRRKGSLKSETVKYGHKSQGTRTEKACAGKGQRHIQPTGSSSRQRGRPTESRT
jgi:hypothetical protein